MTECRSKQFSRDFESYSENFVRCAVLSIRVSVERHLINQHLSPVSKDLRVSRLSFSSLGWGNGINRCTTQGRPLQGESASRVLSHVILFISISFLCSLFPWEILSLGQSSIYRASISIFLYVLQPEFLSALNGNIYSSTQKLRSSQL